ncbi:meiosis inhibitor protein 1-like isoform X2 [Xiphias gladius]|uniref:meiosis inhibitor protein 1-like isoform X2 n=1 Tax=Xiphias gladius TaxID=8245 RepID=UPI001A99FD1B|nr:meiosis inhibitor protein 1-like isoform X2 [Xiphias gladius]
MSRGEIVYDKIHFRHDPKWSSRLGPADGDGLLVCVACVIEMIESEEVASVRKSFALSGISGVLKCSPGALRELLRQDHGVSMRFITSLLGMHHTVEDPATLEKGHQVLVKLLLELQSEVSFRFVLDEIHKQLSDQLSVKGFLPTFNLLGTLLEAVPSVAHSLVTQYVPLLEHLCSALLYPDDALKASSLHVWLKLYGTAGGSAAQSVPIAIRDRVCILLLQTLANAGSPQLVNNCVGLLWLLVQLRETVSVLMNSPDNQVMCNENQIIHTNNSQILSQNQEQQSLDHCLLPLILKQLLLSGDEMLQVTSAKCIASVLVHSPSQYSTPFIKADVPEFLFDRLASTNNEVLLWSAYSCLVLLTEDPLFFTQCHSVYGIESLVRSLEETLRLSNLEVQKQGLLLLTQILERQPPNVRLFPSGPGFVAVSEAVIAGVSSSCMLVATQGASAASALFRLDHQSRPVQYRELEKLVEAITNRFSELPLLSPSHLRSNRSLKRSGPNCQASRSEGFLLQALVCFQAACRLAEECASEPVLKENTFTAPSKQSHAQDSLESLCYCLLHCCDSIWIPTIIRMCEHAPSAQILQYFYFILSSQFTLLPSLMPVFANKLASSGFYRLALENKGILCAGNRNPKLNASCCGFLQKLSMCLLSKSDPASGFYKYDVEEVENLLLYNLPSLCCRLSDWPSLLCEAPGLQLCEYKGQRATQYCLVIVLHLALQQGDRLLPDQIVFSSVLWMLCSVQEQGSCALPRSVLRSALYLLAMTQDKSRNLNGAPLNCISKALSSCQSFSSLYIHHPAFLHFICRYPELAEKFGPLVLELWLTKQAQHTDEGQTMADIQEKGEKIKSHADERQDKVPDTETMELVTLIEKYPAVIVTLLDMICTREAPLAERALGVLEVFLRGQSDYEVDLCAQLGPALLQALQRLSVENVGHGLGQGRNEQGNSLPLVLRLLCVTQASDPPSSSSYSKMDGVHFKLLYHVSNIAGRLKPTNKESLLPALSYLYCCLSMSPAYCTDRAVSMLLSNSGLMNQLQTVLSSSSSTYTAPSLSPSACSFSALLCYIHLLLSSLITLQRVHSAQVHKSISWSLDTAVQRLLLQKRNTDDLLLAKYVVCQPWSRFLLYFLLSSGESCLLHPAILRLITLLLQHSSTVVLWEPDLLQVMEAVERRGVKEFSQEAAQALRLLLTQIQNSVLQTPPTEEHKQRARTMMEALGPHATSKSCTPCQPSKILRVGDVSICLSDFTLKAG